MFDLYSIVLGAFGELIEGLIIFIPRLILSLLVFILGWFIAVGFGKLTTTILHKLHLNKFFEKENWKKAFQKANLKFDVSAFIGSIVKLVLIIVFLWIAVDILGFYQFSFFLKDIVGYLPNILISALIFIVTVIIADIIAKIVTVTAEGANFEGGKLAGEIVRWIVWVFAILAILHQLVIVQPLVEILFIGIVALLVISFGLSFGLGGKQAAADFIENFKNRLKD